LARGRLHRLSLLGDQVAEDQRRLFEPGDPPEGAEIGEAAEILVAGVPARQAKTWQRLHVHIDGEQIRAGVDSVPLDVIQEVMARHPLAQQAALYVGEGH